MDNAEVTKTILKYTVEISGKNRLPCAKAFELAEELGISKKEIGRICNENDIKISVCQLGCFQ
jgi:hypothetical protein